MKARSVVLELLPSRVDVALCDGARVVGARRLAASLPTEPEGWIAALEQLGPALREAVGRLEAKGARTSVLYRSPSQSILLKSLPVSPVEAREAARLAVLEALPYPIETATSETASIGSDNGKDPQHHVVVAADRNDVAAAIARLVGEAGLTFATAAPIDALLMAGQVRSAIADGSGRSARLYVGEQSSVFLVCDDGRLVFAPQMRIGLDTIAGSLTLPLQRRGESDALSLDTPTARRILLEHGMPGRDDIVHEPLGLTGGEVIPLMQPVLQRFIIELRQSLRFGLSDQQRDAMRIFLTGPGSRMPGFGRLIGDELGVPVEVDEAYGEHRWDEPGSAGSQMLDACRDRKLLGGLSLLPVEIARQRTTTRLVRWMWLGAAAAIAIVAIDAVRYHLRLDDVRKQVSALETQSAGQDQLRESTARLAAVSTAMGDLRRRMLAEVGAMPYYGSVLKELSLRTPPNIRLTGISLLYRDGRTQGQISGTAVAAEGTSGVGLQAYIARLQESPLVAEVSLGNVQMGTVDDRPGQRFEATFVCPLAPVEEVLEHTVAVAGERSP